MAFLSVKGDIPLNHSTSEVQGERRVELVRTLLSRSLHSPLHLKCNGKDVNTKISNMEKTFIPEDNSIASIKIREQIIRDFYRGWKERNPSQKKFNLSLKEYINIRMVSIVETSEHAAKNYLSTLAVLQLDAILIGAKKKSVKKAKEGISKIKPRMRHLINVKKLHFLHF